MNSDLKRMWKETVVAYGWKDTTQNPSVSPGRNVAEMCGVPCHFRAGDGSDCSYSRSGRTLRAHCAGHCAARSDKNGVCTQHPSVTIPFRAKASERRLPIFIYYFLLSFLSYYPFPLPPYPKFSFSSFRPFFFLIVFYCVYFCTFFSCYSYKSALSSSSPSHLFLRLHFLFSASSAHVRTSEIVLSGCHRLGSYFVVG
jgi:hypothetical protein